MDLKTLDTNKSIPGILFVFGMLPYSFRLGPEELCGFLFTLLVVTSPIGFRFLVCLWQKFFHPKNDCIKFSVYYSISDY